MALTLSLVGFAIGGALLWAGKVAAGSAVISVDFVALASVFITGKVHERKEREAKFGS